MSRECIFEFTYKGSLKDFGESVSNEMNNLAFFVEFFHARWIEVMVIPATRIAAVKRLILLTHVTVNQGVL